MVKSSNAAQKPEITGRVFMRKQTRFECDMELMIRMPGFVDFVPVSVKNVSAGGLFCQLPDASIPQAGSVLEFRLESPKGAASVDELIGFGVIKWSRDLNLTSQQSGFGLEFTTLPIETVRFIRDEIVRLRKAGKAI